MIEPNDKIFPQLNAALASYTGVEDEQLFRGWLKNSIAATDPAEFPGSAQIADTIQKLIGDDGTWPLVYRLLTMRTGKITLKHEVKHVEVTHSIEGEYSFGRGEAEMTVLTDCDMNRLMIVIGVLVQIVKFIDAESPGRHLELPLREKEPVEPEPKPKKSRKKKDDAEPSGASGTPVVADTETDGGETGDVPAA